MVMSPQRLHRGTRPCMRCNRANDDEPSRLTGQHIHSTAWTGENALLGRPGEHCSGSLLGLVPGNSLATLVSPPPRLREWQDAIRLLGTAVARSPAWSAAKFNALHQIRLSPACLSRSPSLPTSSLPP